MHVATPIGLRFNKRRGCPFSEIMERVGREHENEETEKARRGPRRGRYSAGLRLAPGAALSRRYISWLSYGRGAGRRNKYEPLTLFVVCCAWPGLCRFFKVAQNVGFMTVVTLSPASHFLSVGPHGKAVGTRW